MTTDPYRVRLDIGPGEDGGPVITDPLPVLVPAAGAVRVWSPVAVGERCGLLSPGGEDHSAFVLPGLYSADFESPDDEAARLVVAVGERVRMTLTEDGVTIRSPTTIALAAASDTLVVR